VISLPIFGAGLFAEGSFDSIKHRLSGCGVSVQDRIVMFLISSELESVISHVGDNTSGAFETFQDSFFFCFVSIHDQIVVCLSSSDLESGISPVGGA